MTAKLHPSIIDFWAARGHNVGPGGERLVNGKPETAGTEALRKIAKAVGREQSLVGQIRVLEVELRAERKKNALLKSEIKKQAAANKGEIEALHFELIKVDEDARAKVIRMESRVAKLGGKVSYGAGTRSELEIIDYVTAYHGVPFKVICGRDRRAVICEARFHLVALLRDELNWSWPKIGKRLGGRDHTTAMHAHRTYHARQAEMKETS